MGAPKKSRDNTENLYSLMQRFPTPEAARAHLESLRWADGVFCPHCGTVNESTKMGGKAGARGLWQCNACKAQFSVMVGTVFESSHIPLNKWLIVTHLMNANKKGVSALSISRMMGITYKCAWHMCHRVRAAMTEMDPKKLVGIVEADETFIGGKAKNAHKSRGVPPKTPVLVAVERNGKGRVRAVAVANVDETNIAPFLASRVSKGAILETDSAPAYGNAGANFKAHETVNHSAGEYVRGRAGIQTAESFNGMVKRCIMGAWHRISPEHTNRYLSEVSFRWDHRTITDGARTTIALQGAEGKRLTYRALAGLNEAA
jgi:transposase-like protein